MGVPLEHSREKVTDVIFTNGNESSYQTILDSYLRNTDITIASQSVTGGINDYTLSVEYYKALTPSIKKSNPLNTSTGISINTNIEILFNRPINFYGGITPTVELRTYSSDVLVPSSFKFKKLNHISPYPPGVQGKTDNQVENEGIIITPDSPLNASTKYYVIIKGSNDEKIIVDYIGGNLFAGFYFSNKDDYTFTTA